MELLPCRICQNRVECGVAAAGDAGAGGRVAAFAEGGETGRKLLGVLTVADAEGAGDGLRIAAVKSEQALTG